MPPAQDIVHRTQRLTERTVGKSRRKRMKNLVLNVKCMYPHIRHSDPTVSRIQAALWAVELAESQKELELAALEQAVMELSPIPHIKGKVE